MVDGRWGISDFGSRLSNVRLKHNGLLQFQWNVIQWVHGKIKPLKEKLPQALCRLGEWRMILET